MDNELKAFIEKARARNLTNDEIKSKLLASGWSQEIVAGALGDDLVAPAPPSARRGGTDSPTPLTKLEESVRLKMFEYNIMFLTLWVVAGAMLWIINAFLFTSDTAVITFPLTALLVCLPIFLVLFFRVRAHERRDPELRHVSGRLQLVQSTQSVAFVLLVIHTIFALYQVMNGSDSTPEQLSSRVVSLIIFGGIFGYYWRDTHQASSRR